MNILYVIKRVLKIILCLMGNQCNSLYNGVHEKRRGELQTNLAHAFCTLCSLPI